MARHSAVVSTVFTKQRSGLWSCTVVCVCAALSAFAAKTNAYVVDPAVSYYTQALRGAARSRPGVASSRGFLRLARIHYQAVLLRRRRDFARASQLYGRAIDLQSSGKLVCNEEVPNPVALACSSLNLALTEKARNRWHSARRVFQDGAEQVQQLIRREFHVWVDANHELRFDVAAEAGHIHYQLDQALKWLATLLTSWALLETAQGRSQIARRLVQRAASLDSTKAALMRWKMLSPADNNLGGKQVESRPEAIQSYRSERCFEGISA